MKIAHFPDPVLIVIILPLVLGPRASADVIRVPEDYPTIQEAVWSAAPGDVIEIGPGTYSEHIDIYEMNLTLIGTAGADATIIEGSVYADEIGDTTTLSDLTITGPGFTGVFGGYSFTIRRCRITNKTLGLDLYPDVLLIEDCWFEGNEQAILTDYGYDVRILNSTFVDNGGSDDPGGALCASNMETTTTIQGCTFVTNTTAATGGAVYATTRNPGTWIHLTDCTFIGNTAPAGGAVHAVGNVVFSDCTFDGNGATESGGAILAVADATGTPVVATSAFCRNEPDDVAGNWLDGGGNVYDCAGICPADVDGDGDVGFGDLLSVLSWWGPCGECREDIDGDGVVGFGDLLMVLDGWGACPVMGACCVPDGGCALVPSEVVCAAFGGVYHGDGVACESVECP